MRRAVIAYLATAAGFLALDAIWLSQVGPRLYLPSLGPILAQKPSIAPAAMFYVLYIFAIVYFCVAPALKANAGLKALTHGAVLGLSAYGTYDLTNQATLRIWSTSVTVLDLMWGAFATAAAAEVGFLLTRWLAREAVRSEGRRLR